MASPTNPCSFLNVPKTFDRHFGGTLKGTADPYISGYQFVYFPTLPSNLKFYANTFSAPNMIPDIPHLLGGACLSVTPPGGTLNKAEFTGLGGTKWEVPTNIDYGNTITVKFLEFQGLPIFNIFHGWFRMMRDYRTGTSSLNSPGPVAGLSYTKSSYTGTMLYWTTRPDGLSVEYAAFYTGLFPTKDPQDSFAGDITAVDKLEIDIEFSLDWIWQEPWVYVAAQAYAASYNTASKLAHGGAATPNGLGSTVGLMTDLPTATTP